MILLLWAFFFLFTLSRASSDPEDCHENPANCPSEMSDASKHFEDMLAIQDLFETLQFPPDCTSTKAILFEGIINGLGGQFHSLVGALHVALKLGRTLVPLPRTSMYFNPLVCPENSLNCFLNITSCTSSEVGKPDGDRVIRYSRAKELLKHTGGKPLPLKTFHSSQRWISAALSAVAFRPTADLMEYIETMKTRLKLPSRYITVHVRGNRMLKVEGIKHSHREHMMYLRKISELLNCHDVYFSSDDPAMLPLFVTEFPNMRFFSFPDSEFPSSTHMPRGQSVESFVVKELQRVYLAGEKRDEGKAMLANMHFIGHGVYFIGHFGSNIARWAYELMTKRQFPPGFIDLDNDVFFAHAVPKLPPHVNKLILEANTARTKYLEAS